MLRAGVEGLARGASAAGSEPPVALAVTVLTSEADAGGHVFAHRVADAVEAGCGGLVCAAAEVAAGQDPGAAAARRRARHPARRRPHPRPGPAGDAGRRHRLGADLLVVGRAVTRADDPAAAAAEVAAEVAAGARCPWSLGHPALG